MPRSKIVSNTGDLAGVTVTRAHPNSHHHGIFCQMLPFFMDISWQRTDEVILAALWLTPPELS